MCRVKFGMWIAICGILLCMPGAAFATFIPGEYTADANTVILYHMNEGSGTTVADSASLGGVNDGTLGASQPAWTSSGRFGTGLTAIDGDSEYLSASIGSGVFTNNQMTLDAWIQPTDAAAGASYLAGWSGDGYMYFRYVGGTSLGFGVNASDGTATEWAEVRGDATTNLTGTGWHHVAGTFDNGTLKLYVDNVLISTNVTSYTTLRAPTAFYVAGSVPWDPSYAEEGNYIGAIDEVRLSNIARTDFSAIPEPSAIVLLVTGMFGLLAYAWRKRK